jgi:hypothetical protein
VRQEKPMKWALFNTLRDTLHRGVGSAFDLISLPDARGERARPRLSYSKKFLRILSRGGFSRV